MKKICPSILSADFAKLKEEIKDVEKAGADIIHCDIMDGHFVPNISFGSKIVADVNKITDLPLDVHLMIDNSEYFIDEFFKSGADFISVHYENNFHLNRVITRIKSLGIKAGVVLNPATPVSMLTEIIEYADFILIMSVNPGFGGQKFITNSVAKIRELKNLITKGNYNCLIEIDGGVDIGNIKELSDAGADMFVCGSSIFNSGNRSETIRKMKEIVS